MLFSKFSKGEKGKMQATNDCFYYQSADYSNFFLHLDHKISTNSEIIIKTHPRAQDKKLKTAGCYVGVASTWECLACSQAKNKTNYWLIIKMGADWSPVV